MGAAAFLERKIAAIHRDFKSCFFKSSSEDRLSPGRYFVIHPTTHTHLQTAAHTAVFEPLLLLRSDVGAVGVAGMDPRGRRAPPVGGVRAAQGRWQVCANPRNQKDRGRGADERRARGKHQANTRDCST